MNRFEKKIHDLKLSKNVAIQTAPQIRLIQSNDKMPADKIQMAALSTVPLWESQIMIALGLHRQEGRAARQSAEADLLRIERQLKRRYLKLRSSNRQNGQNPFQVAKLTAQHNRKRDFMVLLCVVQDKLIHR